MLFSTVRNVIPLFCRRRFSSHLMMGIFAPLWLSGAFVFVDGKAALANFRVCNDTAQLVGIALGYRARAGWVSEGWWQVPAKTCSILSKGPLQSRYYYLYAEDATQGGRWTGHVKMCIAQKEFKIVGTKNCFMRGFQQAGFKEYDTGRQANWLVRLSDNSMQAPPNPAQQKK